MRGRCSLCVCVFHFLPQESLNGDMKEMIKFTYDLKCFKDALDIKVFISVFKDYSGTKFTLTDISFTFCRNSILRKSPWKQKQRRITVKVHFYIWIFRMIITTIALMAREDSIPYVGKDLDHNGHDANGDDVNGDDDHDYDDTSSYFSFWSGNKAYQAGKDLDALYLYSQVSQICQVHFRLSSLQIFSNCSCISASLIFKPSIFYQIYHLRILHSSLVV